MKKWSPKTGTLAAEVLKKKKNRILAFDVSQKMQKWLKPMVPLRFLEEVKGGEKKKCLKPWF